MKNNPTDVERTLERKKIIDTNIHPLERTLSKRNTSGITGVCWNKEQECWQIQLYFGRKFKYLGKHKDLDTVRVVICEAWDEYQSSLNA